MPEALWFTDDEEACKLLADDPFALLVGFALLAKCIPALYSDYGRVARLRSPLGYWNELALLCDAGVPLALWVAARSRRPRARVAGVVLLYGLVLTLLLTYSRFGVALACVAAAAWVFRDRKRVESLAALAIGGGAGIAAFGIGLALPGITNDGQPRSVRAHDGWIFALVIVAGAALVAIAALALEQREVALEDRARIERIAGLAALALAVAGLAVSIAFGGRVWSDFTNPGSQLPNNVSHLGSAKSNRWIWWQEAWHAFTRHPGGGTGAGTFDLAWGAFGDLGRWGGVSDAHSLYLETLAELGAVGLVLLAGLVAPVFAAASQPALSATETAALGGAVTFLVHAGLDFDWELPAVTVAGLACLAALCVGERARPAGNYLLFTLMGVEGTTILGYLVYLILHR